MFIHFFLVQKNIDVETLLWIYSTKQIYYLYILEFYKLINVFTWKTNIFFTEKILFIKYISCYIIRILPKQNIIFDNEKWLFLLRNCLMLTGVAFWGNILMTFFFLKVVLLPMNNHTLQILWLEKIEERKYV